MVGENMRFNMREYEINNEQFQLSFMKQKMSRRSKRKKFLKNILYTSERYLICFGCL